MKKVFPSLLRGVLFGIGFIVVIGGFVLLVNATRDETKRSGDGTNSNTKLTAQDYNNLVNEVKSIKTKLNTTETKFKTFVNNPIKEVTYFKMIYDDTGNTGRLYVQGYNGTKASYSPTATPRSRMDPSNKPANWRELTNAYPFSPGLLNGYDYCSIGGIGGLFNGHGESIFLYKSGNNWRMLIRHTGSEALHARIVCMNFKEFSDL